MAFYRLQKLHRGDASREPPIQRDRQVKRQPRREKQRAISHTKLASNLHLDDIGVLLGSFERGLRLLALVRHAQVGVRFRLQVLQVQAL
jgi:hypothetical protein